MSYPRVEDGRLLGIGELFVADVELKGLWHAAFVRSVSPHARISVTKPAGRPDAVVLTAGDLGAGVVPSIHEHGVVPAHLRAWSELCQWEVHQPVLAAERVFFVGQPIALVVASSRYLAEDVAEEVAVDYEELAVLTCPRVAQDPATARLHAGVPDNISVRLRLHAGVPPPAGEDLTTVAGTFTFGRQTGAPVENRGLTVRPDPDGQGVTVWAATQIPHALREAIGQTTGIALERVRVVVPEVGGSFGTKGVLSAEELAVVAGGLRLRRPVRWLEDRYESLCSSIQARDQRHRVSLRADRTGQILSIEDDFDVDAGAYDPFGKSVPYNTAAHVLGPYRIPHVQIRGRSVLTNKAPAAPLRGSGRPEAHFARERALDRLARALRVDPLALRERNLVTPADMPFDTGLLYRDGVPLVYDGFDLPACIEAVRDVAGPLPPAPGGRGVRRGRGVACYVASSGMGPYETAALYLRADGTVAVTSGAASQGQSHATVFARIAAAALGVSPHVCVLTAGDTAMLGDGWGTMASRSAVAAGNAIALAGQRLRAQLEALAEQVVGSAGVAARLERDTVVLTGSERAGFTLAELHRAATGTALEHLLRADDTFRPPTVTWGCGVHVATVEVDPGVRTVRVVDYVAAFDHGPLLDPFVVDGQMYGAIAHGIGGALCEEISYADDGQPPATLFDYLLPVATDIPHIRLVTAAQSRSPTNPLGLRGLGEAGTVAPAAAIANAVEAALADAGVRIDQVPITPARLHRALVAVGR